MYVDDDCRIRMRRAERQDRRERAEAAADLAVRAATRSGTWLTALDLSVAGGRRPAAVQTCSQQRGTS